MQTHAKTNRLSLLLRALRVPAASLALLLALATLPPGVGLPYAETQASSVFQPSEIRPSDETERERAEKRRNVLLLFPVAAITLAIILVLTIKRRK